MAVLAYVLALAEISHNSVIQEVMLRLFTAKAHTSLHGCNSNIYTLQKHAPSAREPHKVTTGNIWALQRHFDVHACWQLQPHQLLNSGSCQVGDIHQPAVRPDLELLSRVLVDVGGGEHSVLAYPGHASRLTLSLAELARLRALQAAGERRGKVRACSRESTVGRVPAL